MILCPHLVPRVPRVLLLCRCHGFVHAHLQVGELCIVVAAVVAAVAVATVIVAAVVVSTVVVVVTVTESKLVLVLQLSQLTEM